MAPFRPSREKRGPDPYLDWKLALFALAAAAAVAGIITDRSWLVWTAIGILALGFLLRFLRR